MPSFAIMANSINTISLITVQYEAILPKVLYLKIQFQCNISLKIKIFNNTTKINSSIFIFNIIILLLLLDISPRYRNRYILIFIDNLRHIFVFTTIHCNHKIISRHNFKTFLALIKTKKLTFRCFLKHTKYPNYYFIKIIL